jgi:pimeloyl-ACP methyl ester carboxylesterase
VERHEVSFESGGLRCAGWLTRPGGEGRPPVVVMAYGFAALGDFWPAFAERFAAAGLATLRFDYRHFGRSEGEPRQLLDVARQLADLSAALGYTRSRGDLDGARVALWGSSFGGGHVVRTAARDPGIRAVVAQVPFVDGIATLPTLGPRALLRLAGAGLQDELGRLAGRPPRCFGVVGAQGVLAAMTTPDAEPGYLGMVPPGSPWENRVCARIALRLPLYRPIRSASRVRCPLLVCVAEDDAICPPEAALRVAARAPRGELRSYPGGHFDVYYEPLLERVADDQVSFLARHLLGAGDAQRPIAGAPA